MSSNRTSPASEHVVLLLDQAFVQQGFKMTNLLQRLQAFFYIRGSVYTCFIITSASLKPNTAICHCKVGNTWKTVLSLPPPSGCIHLFTQLLSSQISFNPVLLCRQRASNLVRFYWFIIIEIEKPLGVWKKKNLKNEPSSPHELLALSLSGWSLSTRRCRRSRHLNTWSRLSHRRGRGWSGGRRFSQKRHVSGWARFHTSSKTVRNKEREWTCVAANNPLCNPVLREQMDNYVAFGKRVKPQGH